MKKIKLTENELTKIISKVISERQQIKEQRAEGIQDVLEYIGDVDLDKWWVGGGVEDPANCDRIKACLHYTIHISSGPQWRDFINCMMGDLADGPYDK